MSHNEKPTKPGQAAPVVLVTGASRGIGAATVREFASHGYTLAIDYNSAASEDAASRLAAECSDAFGVEAKCFRANVADATQTRTLFAQILENWGRLDVLVNNAGITRDGMLARMSEDAFDEVIAVNLKGAFNCLRQAAPIMMKQRFGSIVSVSSIVGLAGNAGQVNYAAAKAGIIGMTKSAARELAPRNIRVNAVAPGFIDTAMTGALSQKARSEVVGRIALKEAGLPEDVAQAIYFLASEHGRYITGQVLTVDGGLAL